MDGQHCIEPTEDAAFELDPLAVTAAKIVLAAIANLFEDKMLTFAELNVLYHLSTAGAVSESQLAQSTGLALPLLSEIGWSLLASGLVLSDDDLLELSPTGYRVLHNLHIVLASALPAVLLETPKRYRPGETPADVMAEREG
jgi:hypothetical protein